jgi:hypothetical protein
MAKSVLRLYSLLVFPVYCTALFTCAFFILKIPGAVLSALLSLPLKPQETNLLLFFCQITYNSQMFNFLIQGALLVTFAVIAVNRKRLVGYAGVLQFFLHFFCIYILVKGTPSFAASINQDIVSNAIFTVVCLVIFGLLPALFVDFVLRLVASKHAAKTHSELKNSTCKHCGEKYLSNPAVCAKCNQRMA